MKMIAQPLEFIPAEPFAAFLARLKELLHEKEVELILVGLPRNMNGSYGPAAMKVQDFAAALRNAVTVPIQLLDERRRGVKSLGDCASNAIAARAASRSPASRSPARDAETSARCDQRRTSSLPVVPIA